MGKFHDDAFPGESDAYRAARDKLLAAEIELRKRVEEVAAMRRALPPGGMLKEDYVFDEGAADLTDRDFVKQTRFSDLFDAGKDNLAVYSFMYAQGGEPCPGCTAFLDSLNGNAPHITQRINLTVVAKAPIGTIRKWARRRDWKNLRLLSAEGNTYNTDYFAERSNGAQIPVMNVFRRTADSIRHTYSTEMLFASAEEGQENRHVDMLWPLWNAFDLTQEGRGTDWWPQLSYD